METASCKTLSVYIFSCCSFCCCSFCSLSFLTFSLCLVRSVIIICEKSMFPHGIEHLLLGRCHFHSYGIIIVGQNAAGFLDQPEQGGILFRVIFQISSSVCGRSAIIPEDALLGSVYSLRPEESGHLKSSHLFLSFHLIILRLLSFSSPSFSFSFFLLYAQ